MNFRKLYDEFRHFGTILDVKERTDRSGFWTVRTIQLGNSIKKFTMLNGEVLFAESVVIEKWERILLKDVLGVLNVIV